jgi:hypothetical protein
MNDHAPKSAVPMSELADKAKADAEKRMMFVMARMVQPETPEEIAEIKKMDRQYRESIFSSLCPPLYRDTTADRIPDQASLAKVMAWKSRPRGADGVCRLNARGLTLVGEPGSGKTRAAWLKLHAAMMAGCRVLAFDGLGWGLAVSSHFGDSGTVEDWIAQCCGVDILFIDDCFKARLTEAQEFALFGVLDRRAAHMRPTILTMNTSGAALAGRTAKTAGESDRFDAIMRRMTEFSDVIQFRKKVPA